MMARSEVALLDVGYRGSRDYIHGTDLWQAMLEITRASHDLRLDIRQPIRRAPFASLEVGGVRTCEPALATFRAASGRPGRIETWHIHETRYQPVRRVAYDDNLIASHGALEAGAISGSVSDGATLIQTVVAYHKRLCEHVTGRRGWWFARLSADLWLDQAEHTRLEVERGNDRFIQSRVILDDSDCTEIIFHRRA